MPSLPVLVLMVILPPLWSTQDLARAYPPSDISKAGVGSTGDHQTESSGSRSGMPSYCHDL